MEIAFNRLESTTLLSLGYLATACLWRKVWTVCELKKIFRMLAQTKMAWCRRQTATIRKAVWQWGKRLAVVAKENGGPIQHFFCWSVTDDSAYCDVLA